MAGTSFDADDIVGHIRAFHGDTSRTPEETREGLIEIQDELEVILDAMGDEGMGHQTGEGNLDGDDDDYDKDD